MSNNRRIKRRHATGDQLLTMQVLAQARREGCTCDPGIDLPAPGSKRISVRHDHECPILGPDHAHEECPQCKAERERA
jgi:hypothetical protein